VFGGGGISPTGDKTKNPARPLQRIFLENFQNIRHISSKKRKKGKISPDLDS